MLNPENVLLPYSISDLPEGPWLVFAPHADDETYGMGGALLRAREAGIDTHVIVLTDGALGGEQDGLIAIRRNEVEHAARELGLASLQCWDEPDRGLEATPTLVAKTAAEIAMCSDYQFVVCGHIHQPQIKMMKGKDGGEVLYLNSGDWVENSTALEYHQEKWTLYRHDRTQVFNPSESISQNKEALNYEQLLQEVISGLQVN